MALNLPLQRDYPYMYARISAKRAKLLDRKAYENMLKMQPNEIAKRLGEGDYKDEIDELGARYDGVELVELALNRNLSNTMQHLSKIAPESIGRVINIYLRRYDIMTLKRLLRWKKGGERGDIEDLFIPVSGYSFEELEELSGKDFEQIVESVRFSDSDINYQDYLENEMELSQVEHALDTAYYDELGVLADQVKSQPFRSFIREELEYENIRTALRLKKYEMSGEEIRQHLTNGRMSDLVESVIRADDLDSAMREVEESEELERSESLEELEQVLQTQRLQRALRMLHTEPLGITSILGYIIGKIIEVQNLRMLIRAKETDIQNLETIRKNLVMA